LDLGCANNLLRCLYFSYPDSISEEPFKGFTLEMMDTFNPTS